MLGAAREKAMSLYKTYRPQQEDFSSCVGQKKFPIGTVVQKLNSFSIRNDLPPITLLVSLLSVVWDDGCCCCCCCCCCWRPFRSWSISWLSFSVRQTDHKKRNDINFKFKFFSFLFSLYWKNRIISAPSIFFPLSYRVPSMSKSYAKLPTTHLSKSAELAIDMQIASLVFNGGAQETKLRTNGRIFSSNTARKKNKFRLCRLCLAPQINPISPSLHPLTLNGLENRQQLICPSSISFIASADLILDSGWFDWTRSLSLVMHGVCEKENVREESQVSRRQSEVIECGLQTFWKG